MRVKDSGSAAELIELYGTGRRDFAGFRIEDGGADFSGCDLSGINLSGVRCERADFTQATLIAARLEGADLNSAGLQHADLTGANLDGANLASTILRGADMTAIVASGAQFADADLTLVDLSGSILTGVNFRGALLDSTIFTNANLDQSHLEFATLKRAKLSRVSARGAVLRETILIDLELDALCADEVIHEGPSHINFQSILRSVEHPRLRAFLYQTGMPDVFAEYMIDCAKSLEPGMVFSLLQSTFISYGGPDASFAKKLASALEVRGVKTFLFSEHSVPGERLHRLMRKGVNDYDRVILICSKASLNRPGLLNELQETLAREARDGGRTYLLPIRLDDYVIDEWRPADEELARAVRDRVIADFRHHESQDEFNAQVTRLIGALKKPMVRPNSI